MSNTSALDSYKSVGDQTGVTDASPHRLIQILFDGAIERLNTAICFVEHNNIEAKNSFINKAIGIISGLQSSLNKEEGGDIAENLDRLYDYMIRVLYEANRDNDQKKITEVINLLKEIKLGWDGISQQVA